MPSMHPLRRVVEHVDKMFKLELLPAWHLLVTHGVTVGTIGCLLWLDSILPYTGPNSRMLGVI